MHADIIHTADGSHSLINKELNESYHSINGAINESFHVFIQEGLKHHYKKSLKVLEIGFGTGLNAFLTLIEAEENHLDIQYTSIEYYPISAETVNLLNYNKLLPAEHKNAFKQLHVSAWNKPVHISPYFQLIKLKKDFSYLMLEEQYDLIYFDAFSPDKQPEMWTEERFQMLYAHANKDAILTTYSAKGEVRRRLQAVGFTVERIPGPKGKREILRAIKN